MKYEKKDLPFFPFRGTEGDLRDILAEINLISKKAYERKYIAHGDLLYKL